VSCRAGSRYPHRHWPWTNRRGWGGGCRLPPAHTVRAAAGGGDGPVTQTAIRRNLGKARPAAEASTGVGSVAWWVAGGLVSLALRVGADVVFNYPVNHLGSVSACLSGDMVDAFEQKPVHGDRNLKPLGLGGGSGLHRARKFSSTHTGHSVTYPSRCNNRSRHQGIVGVFNGSASIIPLDGPPCLLFGQVEATSTRLPHGAEERCVIRKRKRANVPGAWFFRTHTITFQVVLAQVPLSSNGVRCMCRVEPESKVILISTDVPPWARLPLVGKALAVLWRKGLAMDRKLPDAEYVAGPLDCKAGNGTAINQVDGPDGVPLLLIGGGSSGSWRAPRAGRG